MKFCMRLIVSTFNLMIISNFVISCSNTPKNQPTATSSDLRSTGNSPATLLLLHRAQVFDSKGDWQNALNAYNSYLELAPTPETESIRLRTAEILELLRQPTLAILRYRQVIAASTGRAPQLEALALFGLGRALQAQGQRTESLVALLDAERRSTELPENIRWAELPARIASVYAQIGKLNVAQIYYQRAEKRMYSLRNKDDDWWAHTLYEMGRATVSQINWNQFEKDLTPWNKAQKYLFEACKLNSTIWSPAAAEEIKSTYNKIWDVISKGVHYKNQIHPEDSLTPENNLALEQESHSRSPASLPSKEMNENEEDDLTSTRELQKTKWRRAEILIESLSTLVQQVPPDGTSTLFDHPETKADLDKKNPHEKRKETEVVIAFAQEMKKRALEMLNEPPIGTELTPEAQERQDKIQGRVVDPSDELEKMNSPSHTSKRRQ